MLNGRPAEPDRLERRRRWVSIALVATLVASGAFVGFVMEALARVNAPHGPVLTLYAAPPDPTTLPIRHVVWIIQENHAYDNLFGPYCPRVGPYCADAARGLPPGTCVPINGSVWSDGCIRPAPVPDAWSPAATYDLDHSWNASHIDYAQGANDGWVAGELRQFDGTLAPFPFDYYTGSTAPYYWDLAEQYALDDNFFSSVLSYSTPNHWATFASSVPEVSLYYFLQHQSIPNNWTLLHGLASYQRAYLNEANATPTIADVLSGHPTVSWKYYDYPMPSGWTGYNSSIEDQRSFDYWNPAAGQSESYLDPAFNSHYVARAQIFADAAAGNLPNISWVIPDFFHSDHPPATLVHGQTWVSEVIDAIERSPDWNSTAIFLMWDDYGGYYDHVSPPATLPWGLSFRVPLLIVSPYARENYVSHDFGYFESILRWEEWRFGLPAVGPIDAHAPLPLGAFDFNQTPRAPWILPSNPNATRYPATLQPGPAPPTPRDLHVYSQTNGTLVQWAIPDGGGSVANFTLAFGPTGGPLRTLSIDGASDGIWIPHLALTGSWVFHLQARDGSRHSGTATVSGVPLAPAPVGLLPATPALRVVDPGREAAPLPP
jgi:phospholipase C